MMKSLPNFRVVTMRDTLPKQINQSESTIVNLDSHTHSGTHWCLIYNNPQDDKNVYYFDSYGQPPPKEVEKYLKTSGKKILYNTSILQNLNSSMCGYFCIYVARELNKGRSLYDCIYTLSQIDSTANDRWLQDYFSV